MDTEVKIDRLDKVWLIDSITIGNRGDFAKPINILL